MAVSEVNGPQVSHRKGFPEVFGFKDVADCLGVKGSNIQHIKDLPEHVAECSSGRIWLADEIRPFARMYAERRRR